MAFYEIEFPLAGLSEVTVETALEAAGALSTTLLDRGDEPILEPKPGEVRLWHDTLVRALFDAAQDPAATLAQLIGALGATLEESARVRAVKDEVWERVWLKDWQARRFGPRLWVVPSHAADPDDAAAVIVRLDPGLAFGTGAHPTTALCLQVLESLPLSGRTVIDYGCGSGILGIAALKLGAAAVTAIDIDPQALTATRDNAARNGVGERLTVQDSAPSCPAHCVLANILSGPLVDLAPVLTGACERGGHLVLSGLLKSQAYMVKAAYGTDFAIVRTIERDEWCCIYAQRTG
jgi:ribosomal protein L11 methyltransferase